MFKAHHKILGQDIVSLDPRLQQSQLYAWSNDHHLTCPECHTEVGFRAGTKRRPHFFHRALLDCTYQVEDPEVSAARAVLYSSLARKVAARQGEIDLEVQLPGAPKGDRIDVWVKLPNHPPIAYRIFKKGPRTSKLDEIITLTKSHGAIPRQLLTISRRTWEEGADEPRLVIPAYDRNLLFPRSWDQYHVRQLAQPLSRCLAYIDPQQETLVLYRGLWHPPDCNPNFHEYSQELQAPLQDLLMLKDGEFIFPNEVQLKAAWEEWRQEELARQAAEAERRHKEEQDRRAEAAALQRRIRQDQAVGTRIRATMDGIVATCEQSLIADGQALIGGATITVPHPEIYQRPPEYWQPYLAAFIQWAGVPFRFGQAQELVLARAKPAGPRYMRFEQANVRVFLEHLIAAGQIKPQQDVWLQPLRPRVWPAPTGEWGVCLVCRTVTNQWNAFDGELHIGKCRYCFPKP